MLGYCENSLNGQKIKSAPTASVTVVFTFASQDIFLTITSLRSSLGVVEPVLHIPLKNSGDSDLLCRGVFLCIRCSGIHRGMGTHISRVKSVDLDVWTPEQMDVRSLIFLIV